VAWSFNTYIGLSSLPDLIITWRNAFFGHVTRMFDNVSAHRAFWCQLDGHTTWATARLQLETSTGRLRMKWLDQIRSHKSLPPSVLWSMPLVETICGGGSPSWRNNNDDWFYYMPVTHKFHTSNKRQQPVSVKLKRKRASMYITTHMYK